MSIKVDHDGGCNYIVKICGVERADFIRLMALRKQAGVSVLLTIIERGLIELTGELPEKRSTDELER